MTSWRKGAKDSVIEPRPCTIETKVPEIKQKKYIKKLTNIGLKPFRLYVCNSLTGSTDLKMF